MAIRQYQQEENLFEMVEMEKRSRQLGGQAPFMHPGPALRPQHDEDDAREPDADARPMVGGARWPEAGYAARSGMVYNPSSYGTVGGNGYMGGVPMPSTEQQDRDGGYGAHAAHQTLEEPHSDVARRVARPEAASASLVAQVQAQLAGSSAELKETGSTAHASQGRGGVPTQVAAEAQPRRRVAAKVKAAPLTRYGRV